MCATGRRRGGAPGFVRPLEDQRLAWADLAGNNRLDSFENLVTNDSVALLFMTAEVIEEELEREYKATL